MSAEVKKEIQLEIGHVLFIDIVGYSKLLINEQRSLRETLNQIVRSTQEFRSADAAGKLIKIPTGDGMALVFYNSPENPVECALEVSRALKEHPELQLRMGVHSGPVSAVIDVNNQANVAGAGINTAQRVMDCGDAGHILLSKRVAEDLEQYAHWRPHLHDLGESEVKHGGRVYLVNLYTQELGNPDLPQKLVRPRGWKKTAATTPGPKSRTAKWLLPGALALIACAAAIGLLTFRAKPVLSPTANSSPSSPGLVVPEKSIAVLPFENLSRDPDNAFFTDGVQDEILTDLAKIADLKVISRTSVMQYKTGVVRNLREIGQQLGVSHLLEGSVQRAGGKVRVNAQLVDARNDAHLWAQTYDRDLADVFAIQSEIAKAIADQLRAKLSPNEKREIEQPPTADVTAFDLYSRAKNLILTTSLSAIGGKNLLEAVDLLNQALARDPSFFRAQCLLVHTHDDLYFIGIDHTPARLALAEAALQAAFRLRPEAGEAHLARAENLYRGYLDYEGALAELDIARRTLPNDSRIFELTGYIARRQGKQEEGWHALERAVELDPRNFFILQQIALSYENLRRYLERVTVLDRALAIKPDDVETRVDRASVDLDWKADTGPLHQTIDEIRAKDPAEIQTVADSWLLCALAEHDAAAAEAALTALGDNDFIDGEMQFSRTFNEGLAARMAKDDARARDAFTAAHARQEKVVQAEPNYGPALCLLGLIDAALGRKEEALHEGKRAVELLPVEKDSIGGAQMLEYLAVIAAWVGDNELACEQLATAVRLPGRLSYGRLKLLPFWDPLRGDLRFEKIVASLAPKS